MGDSPAKVLKFTVTNKKLLLSSLTTLLSGVLVGIFLVLLLSKIPLPVESQIYKTLGIKKPHIVGFQPFWLLKRADKNYSAQTTAFTYFGLTLDSDGTILKLVNPQEEEPGWTTLRSVSLGDRLNQAQKNRLKLSLLIHNSDEEDINILIEKPENHAQNLISEVTPIMQKHGFTDLNLDIESFRQASQSAQKQFTTFVKEVKKGVEENNLGTLTLEINPTALVKNRLTNTKDLGKIADFLVLMAYDFHYVNSYFTGPVAPIGGAGQVREYDIKTALEEMQKIVPSEKIILGIPLYGYGWETISDEPGAPTIPGGGSIASNRRVTEILASCDNCTKAFDQHSQQPYVIFPESENSYFHQIFYENQESLAQKLELAKKYKLGGVALWALGYEGEAILKPLEDYKRSVEWAK